MTASAINDGSYTKAMNDGKDKKAKHDDNKPHVTLRGDSQRKIDQGDTATSDTQTASNGQGGREAGRQGERETGRQSDTMKGRFRI